MPEKVKSRKRTNVEDDINQSKITDFYPIRRSSRKTGKCLEEDRLEEMKRVIQTNVDSGLEIIQTEVKGRGVIATRPFDKGDLVVEYAGDIIDIKDAKSRELDYSTNKMVGCYMYYFEYRNKRYCVDATVETGRLGRLVNHSRKKPNCKTKAIGINGKPRLVLIASKNINCGQEILYDYGDRSKLSIQEHPWLAN